MQYVSPKISTQKLVCPPLLPICPRERKKNPEMHLSLQVLQTFLQNSKAETGLAGLSWIIGW